ncbi:MAG: hypothetical protein E5Y25_11690 [Mesorhizobium sp.]|nr:MAG: hypothetical protein E5Y25_11690 [Mesorhizobium sp.]
MNALCIRYRQAGARCRRAWRSAASRCPRIACASWRHAQESAACADLPIARWWAIHCAECGKYLGTWDELQTDFERQGGTEGVFRLDKGRIQKLASSQ